MPKYGLIAVEGPHDIEFVRGLLRPFGLKRVQYEKDLDRFLERLVTRTFPTRGDLLKRHPVEWMNIIMLEARAKANRTFVNPLTQSIHGLDADQILLTEFFGLKTTRAPGKVTQLENLQRKARHGDKAAARKIILAMAEGTADETIP